MAAARRKVSAYDHVLYEYLPPQKDQEQQRVRHLWQPNPVRNSTFAINSYFLLWVAYKVGIVFCPTNFRTQSYLVWNQKRFAFFGTIINYGKNVTKS